MTKNLHELIAELVRLPASDRLMLAQMLIDSVRSEPFTPPEGETQRSFFEGQSWLLAMAGRYAGGPGDSAERAEEILEHSVNKIGGLSVD